MMIKIGLTNAKGGVAKTTTSVNVAAGLAKRGYKTLLIDCDFQANASISMGFPRKELKPSLVELFSGTPLEEVIRKTYIENLSIITGSEDLMGFDAAVAGEEDCEFILREFLQELDPSYEFVIMDTPPSLSMLPINVLVAADFLVVPVQPMYTGAEGIATLVKIISDLRIKLDGKVGTIAGVLITMLDRRLGTMLETSQLLRESLEGLVFEIEIPFNSKQAEASSFGQVIFDYNKRSATARAYDIFINELLERIGYTEKTGERYHATPQN